MYQTVLDEYMKSYNCISDVHRYVEFFDINNYGNIITIFVAILILLLLWYVYYQKN